MRRNTEYSVILYVLIGLVVVLSILLALALVENEKILNGWREAQDFWQSLPLVYPEIGK